MTPEAAVARCTTILAHAWMVRTFLKHADEVQENEDMLDVPRTLYDSIRAVEPAFQRGDHADYLRRLKGKLPKLRRAAEYFNAHFREFSPHTNFEMAALSLLGVVSELEAVFAAVAAPTSGGAGVPPAAVSQTGGTPAPPEGDTPVPA